MDIRRAAAADIPMLHALVHRCYRGAAARKGWTHEADLLGGQRTDADALGRIIADSSQAILIAMGGNDLVGCVQIADKGRGLAYLGLLSVDPGCQAAGLGRRLIGAAEAEATTRLGAHRIEMTVIRQRAELIAYYVRRGYAETGDERPFPLDDPRYGLPTRRDLSFVVLAKTL